MKVFLYKVVESTDRGTPHINKDFDVKVVEDFYKFFYLPSTGAYGVNGWHE